MIDDARTSIGYVIEKSVIVVQETDKLLREVLRIEPIPEQSDLSLGVPVRTQIQATCQQVVGGRANDDTGTGQSMLRSRGGGPRKRRADTDNTQSGQQASGKYHTTFLCETFARI